MEKAIQQVEQYIQNNLGQPLGTVQLADVACLSPIHFHRKFKAATGCTPALYVEVHRLRHSLELLKEGVQVQEVAFQLGFANYETFSRAFKRHCKIAPSDLQHLMQRLEENSDPDRPLLLSRSRQPHHLQYLLKDAVERGIFNPMQLHLLEVCIITPKEHGYRSRRAEEKFQLSLEPALARELCNSLKR